MDEPIAISLAECARLLSVTRKHVYYLIATDPDFPRTFWLGRCRRVMKSEVLQYIANKAKRPAKFPEMV
jgi:predicted DNA-binding transcriptional regulator AlpA